jgi:hypothetical protein
MVMLRQNEKISPQEPNPNFKLSIIAIFRCEPLVFGDFHLI